MLKYHSSDQNLNTTLVDYSDYLQNIILLSVFFSTNNNKNVKVREEERERERDEILQIESNIFNGGNFIRFCC